MPRERGESLGPLFDAFPALLERRATDQERAQFERYADLLLLWNRTHNLTGLRTTASIGKGLFLDSLLFRSMLPRGPGLRMVDIGAGAGIPGIPLRIVDPSIVLTLVESKRKRRIVLPSGAFEASTRAMRCLSPTRISCCSGINRASAGTG